MPGTRELRLFRVPEAVVKLSFLRVGGRTRERVRVFLSARIANHKRYLGFAYRAGQILPSLPTVKDSVGRSAVVMGWIAGRAYRLGVGSVPSPQRVIEKAGYEGEFLRLTTSDGEKVVWVNGGPANVKRNGRRVYPTRRIALKHSFRPGEKP